MWNNMEEEIEEMYDDISFIPKYNIYMCSNKTQNLY